MLSQSSWRCRKCKVFIRYGKVKTCAHKTDHDTTNGTVSGSRIYEVRRNDKKWAESTSWSIFLLDGQHLCDTLYREYEQVISDICCKSDCNNTRRLIAHPVELCGHPFKPGWRRWIKGPDFLTKPSDDWPKRPEELSVTTQDNDPEVKKGALVYVTDASNNCDKHIVVEVFERFSSWCRGKRVFTWMLRYKRNLRSRNQDRSDLQTTCPIPPISLTELVNAETEILKHVQGSSFKDELSRLQRKETDRKTSNTSCIAKPDPILMGGLIRVGVVSIKLKSMMTLATQSSFPKTTMQSTLSQNSTTISLVTLAWNIRCPWYGRNSG